MFTTEIFAATPSPDVIALCARAMDPPRGLKMAGRRLAALQAYNLACQTSTDPATDGAAFRLIADALAMLTPRPAADDAPEPAMVADDDPGPVLSSCRDMIAVTDALPVIADQPATHGEWSCYSAAKRAARGRLYHPGNAALFTFADGKTIATALPHHAKEALPDWAKAAQMAVAFYRASRTRDFLRLVGWTYGNMITTRAEEYAGSCAIPEIVSGLDLQRGAYVDAASANDLTAESRTGPAYLAELVPFALAADGDWSAAWTLAMAHLGNAMDRDAKRSKAEKDRADYIRWWINALDPVPALSNLITEADDAAARAQGPDAVYRLVMAAPADRARLVSDWSRPLMAA